MKLDEPVNKESLAWRLAHSERSVNVSDYYD